MICPYCGGNSQVTNSRASRASKSVWRRRRCKLCSTVWTTKEEYDLSTTHRVKDSVLGTLEPFQRDILFMSVYDAVRHRKDQLGDATGLTATIIDKVLSLKSPILDKKNLILAAQEVLSNFDPTAASVFSATHKP